MSRAKTRSLMRKDLALAPLAAVIARHFPRAGMQEDGEMSDECLAFTQAAAPLAAQYATLRQQAHESESRRQRYEAIALTAQQLRFALEGLTESELNMLAAQQDVAHQAYVNELDEHRSYDLGIQHEVSGEPYGPRSAYHMQQWQDLRWLEQGAKRLCSPRKRGRPENIAERWAARQFVFLCHKHGWSPVRVAHSGTEKQQSDLQSSNAVMCLAAIFVAGGEHEVRAKSAALSALKPLRDKFTYVEWTAGSFDHPYLDPEPNEYTVSLKELTADRHHGIGQLPNFTPENE